MIIKYVLTAIHAMWICKEFIILKEVVGHIFLRAGNAYSWWNKSTYSSTNFPTPEKEVEHCNKSEPSSKICTLIWANAILNGS